MSTVTSSDGTKIAFERVGQGPPVVVVDGAFLYRAIDPWTPEFAKQLADKHTVYPYERRGRGDSGDTAPYAIDREIEDLAAVIDEAGGPRRCWACPQAPCWPAEEVEAMRTQPFFPAMEAIAHTVAYDGEIMEGLMSGKPVPADRWRSVSVPTLVAYGGASEQWFHSAAKAVGQALPNAKVQRLDGQTHEVAADVLAAVVAEHFAG